MADLLIVPVPIFNRDMAVEAYYFRYQKGNNLFASLQTAAVFDGASLSPPLEMLNLVGIDALTINQPVVIPIGGIMLLGNLRSQYAGQPADRIIFLVSGEDTKPEEPYLSPMREMRELGYRFAIRDIGVSHLDRFAPLLELCDYFYFSAKSLPPAQADALIIALGTKFRHLSVAATHVETTEQFEALKMRNINWFEGRFYRVPINRGQTNISPLKANLIRLLNVVRDQNFELVNVSGIIQRDPALSVSLMRMINSPHLGLSQKVRTIGHAVTLLGQNEVRKWVTTSVSRSLSADKPNEITRLSLVRAKFAENLAAPFKMKQESQGLFLMGLFSVLDVVLEVSMDEALKMVQVSDEIASALLKKEGRFYPVLSFVINYEIAEWSLISHQLIVNDMTTEDAYQAYIDAVSWYSDLTREGVEEEIQLEAES